VPVFTSDGAICRDGGDANLTRNEMRRNHANGTSELQSIL
jgi:hypothetical protein